MTRPCRAAQAQVAEAAAADVAARDESLGRRGAHEERAAELRALLEAEEAAVRACDAEVAAAEERIEAVRGGFSKPTAQLPRCSV